jgi:hypothetical protein
MSNFEAHKDSETLRRATKAFSLILLEEIMPDLRLAARGCGYALATHGSLARDIDMVAFPWVDDADEPELLVSRLIGVLSGKVGRAIEIGGRGVKPHGRQAYTIIASGAAMPEIDLSIMPTGGKTDDGLA